jgi:mono/diheme cytochrome c family protein
VNPLANRRDAEPGGRKLFHDRCAVCHGSLAQGTERAPDLTSGRVQAQSDGALFWKITQGHTRRGMPTFSYLPDVQRWQLVVHLRAAARQAP